MPTFLSSALYLVNLLEGASTCYLCQFLFLLLDVRPARAFSSPMALAAISVARRLGLVDGLLVAYIGGVTHLDVASLVR